MSMRRDCVRCCQRRDAAHAVSLAGRHNPAPPAGRRRRAFRTGSPSHGCGLSVSDPEAEQAWEGGPLAYRLRYVPGGGERSKCGAIRQA
jgi:hypothetical protein